MELAELKDKEAIPIVERLHEREYIDEMIYGEFEDFLAIYRPQPPKPRALSPRTLFDLYNFKD